MTYNILSSYFLGDLYDNTKLHLEVSNDKLIHFVQRNENNDEQYRISFTKQMWEKFIRIFEIINFVNTNNVDLDPPNEKLFYVIDTNQTIISVNVFYENNDDQQWACISLKTADGFEMILNDIILTQLYNICDVTSYFFNFKLPKLDFFIPT